MSELKTKVNDADVLAFLNDLDDESKRSDSLKILKWMEQLTGETAKMWGKSIIGFGQYHYKYASGREGDWMAIGFSPRKQNLTLYIMPGFDQYDHLLSTLGKYKTGKSCLYIKKLSDINEGILKSLISESYKYMSLNYP